MSFTRARSWLLASALIVVLAAVLLVVAVPAEAGAPVCFGVPDSSVNCTSDTNWDLFSCHELRARCRDEVNYPDYQVWKRDAHDNWKLVCGPTGEGFCVAPAE